MRRAEEQRTVEPVGDDVLRQQRLLFVARHLRRVTVARRDGLHHRGGTAGDVAQRETGRDRDTDLDRDDEVEHDGGCGREHEHDGVGAGRVPDGAHVVHLDHADRGDHEHSGERGERDLGHERATEEHHGDQYQRMDNGRQPGSGARPHVHCGAGNRAGRGHPAEQR